MQELDRDVIKKAVRSAVECLYSIIALWETSFLFKPAGRGLVRFRISGIDKRGENGKTASRVGWGDKVEVKQ